MSDEETLAQAKSYVGELTEALNSLGSISLGESTYSWDHRHVLLLTTSALQKLKRLRDAARQSDPAAPKTLAYTTQAVLRIADAIIDGTPFAPPEI